MTRISRGKIQLQRERVDLNELIGRVIDDHRSVVAQNGLQLDVDLPRTPLWIDGDRTRLTQVVGNLLQNAAKFTELGGRISVSLASNDNLREAVFRVRDTGVGIGADMLPRVFEPFAQADATLARSKGGLGLGLTLVKALVEMHGGRVTVESEGVGKGAEFAMRLPVGGEGARPLHAAEPARVRPQRILIIEDNVDAANSLREVLELDGHSVAVAYSGTQGISTARSFRPEVVLCDIGLPGIDGYQVAQALRGDPVLRDTRLVALTGYAGPEDVARSSAAGFDAHIAKPPDVEELRGRLASKS
jgi:two-component system CheB/CheR fusion protein